jgi:hypothetical protein
MLKKQSKSAEREEFLLLSILCSLILRLAVSSDATSAVENVSLSNLRNNT